MWLVDGLTNALRMVWEVWWALVLGFALSAIVQAWVPRRRLERALGGRGLPEVALASGLGAASSSCSYAAVAIAKSLFERGRASSRRWCSSSPRRTSSSSSGSSSGSSSAGGSRAAEFVGGLVLVVLLWAALRLVVSPEREEALRQEVAAREAGHRHHSASSGDVPLRQRVRSLQAWSDVAHNFRGDWQMLWKEIAAGFLIAGYVATLPTSFFSALFLTHAWAPLRIAENVLVGPIVAALAFVCSIGNVPLAAVLWAGGGSFAGVLAFLYGDLIVHPDRGVYRKVYGGRVAALLVGVMYGAMVVAALVVDGLFSLFGLVPLHRPSVASVAERPVTWNYTSVLDLVGVAVFVALIGLTLRRGAKDPVCGMTVDRHAGGPTSPHDGRTVYFCSAHCKRHVRREPGGIHMTHGYVLSDDKEALLARLRRIEGQVRGLQQMVEEERVLHRHPHAGLGRDRGPRAASRCSSSRTTSATACATGGEERVDELMDASRAAVRSRVAVSRHRPRGRGGASCRPGGVSPRGGARATPSSGRWRGACGGRPAPRGAARRSGRRRARGFGAASARPARPRARPGRAWRARAAARGSVSPADSATSNRPSARVERLLRVLAARPARAGEAEGDLRANRLDVHGGDSA